MNNSSNHNLFPNEQQLSTAKVLIIDDEEAHVRVLEWALKQANFPNFHSLTDSTRATEEFCRFQPDILLLDLNMPKVDGFEVLERVKTILPPDEFVPVLMMTADTTAETRRRALSTGAHDFVNKPLDYSEVILRIKNLLQTRYMFRQMRDMRAQLEAVSATASAKA